MARLSPVGEVRIILNWNMGRTCQIRAPSEIHEQEGSVILPLPSNTPTGNAGRCRKKQHIRAAIVTIRSAMHRSQAWQGAVAATSKRFVRNSAPQFQHITPFCASRIARGKRLVRVDRFDISRIASALPGLKNWAELIRGRISLPKQHVVHVVVLSIVGIVVLANISAKDTGRDSMLYRLFGSEDIVVEGPLSSNLANLRMSPSVGGGNFAFAAGQLSGGIREGDVEFELANSFDGNALVATNLPATVGSTETESAGKQNNIVAHEVSAGETPSIIASRYGVSTDSILWSNGITANDIIKTGDILVIPPVSGVVHEIKKGDTLSAIATTYDVDVSGILEHNGMSEGEALAIGKEVVVPGGRVAPPPPRPVVAKARPSTPSAPRTASPAPANTSVSGFIWPTPAVRGISQYFGWRHTGIDIPNRSLPPVHASKAGTVTFSGWLGGYGRLVILDHGGGVTTYYAHLNKPYVSKGERVSQGQAIGQLGNTGRSTGPHLHFEVRLNGSPVNPLNYL